MLNIASLLLHHKTAKRNHDIFQFYIPAQAHSVCGRVRVKEMVGVSLKV